MIKKKKNGNKIVKIVEEDKTINYYINKIKLIDAYSFVNKKYKTYNLETKQYILSKMKKYINLLNGDKIMNYKI